MYDRILYPTDGSIGAVAALDHARYLARLCDATVHVLYTVEPVHRTGLGDDHQRDEDPGLGNDPKRDDEPGLGGAPDGDDETREQYAEEARALVEDAATEFEAAETVTAVRSGDPHEAILEYVTDNDVNLIVMGTHGRTGLDRYLIGSVTEKVVRLSDVPVVTVRRDGSASDPTAGDA